MLQDHVDEGSSSTAPLPSSPGFGQATRDSPNERNGTNNGEGRNANDAGDAAHLVLPDHITPLSTTIALDDLKVLALKKALEFPPRDVINDIIRSFVCYVYPLLPAIRLDDFLAAMEGEPGKTISPLLFQAVLLAGAAFTDFSHSQHSSFQGSIDAQKILFSRSKLLFDMEVDTNPVVMIQALLLMTYWHSQLNDTKGRTYWLRIALSLAADIGLHNPDLQHQDVEEYNFRRRLWSCCLIRTQLICIGERRQVVMPRAESGRCTLTFDQWNGGALSRAIDACSAVSHTREQMDKLGWILVQQIELCGIIQDTLDTLYELSGLRKVALSDSIMMLIPRTKDTGSLVIALDDRLREWYKNASRIGLFDNQHDDHGSVVPVHSAMVEMLYFTALSLVHRPLMVQKRQQETATEAMRLFASETLRSSACRIVEIGRNLELHGRIAHLPPVATAIFIAAGIQHLKDAMSPNLARCRSGSVYLGQTLAIFRLLGGRYNHVNAAIEFFSRIQHLEHFDHSLEWEDRVQPKNSSKPGLERHGVNNDIEIGPGLSTSLTAQTSQNTTSSLEGETEENFVQNNDTLDQFWDQSPLTPSLDAFTDIIFGTRF